jgi:hypothetical protein
MALKTRSASRWWSRLHFLLRFLGLTGLLAGGVGVGLAFLKNVLSWNLLSSTEFLRSTLLGEAGDEMTRVGVGLLLGGGLLALLALVVEMLAILTMAAGRRSAFGLNAALQVALAAALLAGVNLFSYSHYVRADWTLRRQFTLPAKVQSELSQLKGETTIVAYQRHKTFGILNDKPDAYDYAAERKVVEKVKDLVEQFREFGPQFHVVVLDVEEEGYNDKLARLTENAKELRDAIDSAPENSIFFHAGGRVQRLSFNDFYQLDKTASKEADGGRGNLVLLNQGVEPFARKVLNIDEKRPRVAVAVIHEILTTEATEGTEETYTLRGLKKALTARGFEVRDVILKKWSEFGPPEPAVYTYDESKLDRLEEELAEVDASIKTLDQELQALSEHTKEWQTKPPAELQKTDIAKQLGLKQVNEEIRRAVLKRVLEPNVAIRQFELDQNRKEREALAGEKNGLPVENLAEQRRMSDLKAKLERSLADCDLLFIPRMTIRNIMLGDRIPSRLYRLDPGQLDAIKDFLKAGKPVFACFGPTNESPEDQMRLMSLGPPGSDELETLFAKLGVKFGKQTVLYNVESKSFAERRSGLFVSVAPVEVPSVEFEGKADLPGSLAKPDAPERNPNPIRSSMRIAAHSLGKTLDLRIRYARPIYYQPEEGQAQRFEPEFMLTSAASWNEDQPFPSRERTPRFEPPKPDDPTKGTLDEKRRGPFPIGVAVEAPVPADWYTDGEAKPAKVRVAAVGNGGLFTGLDLPPAKEELLLNTCNWLLGRDDLLPRSDNVWSYPRVSLDSNIHTIWHWGTQLVLPGVFLYLGVVVLMVRHLR